LLTRGNRVGEVLTSPPKGISYTKVCSVHISGVFEQVHAVARATNT